MSSVRRKDVSLIEISIAVTEFVDRSPYVCENKCAARGAKRRLGRGFFSLWERSPGHERRVANLRGDRDTREGGWDSKGPERRARKRTNKKERARKKSDCVD